MCSRTSQVDVGAMLNDEKALKEALALAAGGRFEFLQPTQPVEATAGPFVLRVAEGMRDK